MNEFVRDASDEQVRAWDRSLPWLQQESEELISAHEPARSYTAILEYTLPLEERRPDLIILENGAIVVIELKGKEVPSAGDVDQAAAYARDLRNYHRECHGRDVLAILIPERATAIDETRDGVRIIAKESLDSVLGEIAKKAPGPPVTVEAFLSDDAYSPLPTLVNAARWLFEKRSSPALWRTKAETEEALGTISSIAHEAHRTNSRRLVLITGLPGTGKTLVGLRLVHASFLDDLAVPRAGGKPVSPAVFLSGNGPLVEVLQDALRRSGADGKVFVRDVRGYRLHYSRPSSPVPPEHVLVFDEAQRAYDADFLKYKHRRDEKRGKKVGAAPEGTEPEQFVRFGERIPGWCVLVALIGSGQEIFSGEDGGITQWRTAIESAAQRASWSVHSPPDLRDVFEGCSAPVSYHRQLNLNVELRFHAAARVHVFVERVLMGLDPAESRETAERLHREGVRFLLTRDLEAARSYATDRYDSHLEARYGLIASSKDRLLPGFGVPNQFQATRFPPGPWFNAPSESPESCRRMDRVATEFSVQGLELDLAILAWGSDYARVGGDWSVSKSGKYAYPVREPETIRRNVYRVLLTRGRDGTVVFVPPDPYLDETFTFLIASGFRPLSAS